MTRPLRLAVLCAAALAIAACQKTDAPGEKLEARPYGTWGVDVAGMNRAVSPGEDLYMYAVGGAHEKMQIPADRAGWGAFYELIELSNARLRRIIEASASQVRPPRACTRRCSRMACSR